MVRERGDLRAHRRRQHDRVTIDTHRAAGLALGACLVERHFTLDRAMWGTDQVASVEPQGMTRLVKDIRAVEVALGDGIKRVYPSELPARDKLRRVTLP